jgi:predicted O-methyltransferase YrrM
MDQEYDRLVCEISRIRPLVAPEYMTENKALAIANLWKYLRPKSIVEIGTFKGTGACFLGAMASVFGGHVTTIDLPWTAQDNEYFQAGTVEAQLQKCEVTNVTVIRRQDGAEGWWRDYFIEGRPPLDFVYLDGGHQWLNTAAQLLMAYSALRPGGWVCMDDLNNLKYPDVELVWQVLTPPLTREIGRHSRELMGFLMRP